MSEENAPDELTVIVGKTSCVVCKVPLKSESVYHSHTILSLGPGVPSVTGGHHAVEYYCPQCGLKYRPPGR